MKDYMPESDYKLYRGKVISNTDPDNFGRMQIQVLPHMNDVVDSTMFPWVSPFMGTGDSDRQSYTPLPIGTKVYVLSTHMFRENYWIAPKHIEGLFDFDSVNSDLSGISENGSFNLENLKFIQYESGNIHFENVKTGNTGILHQSGAYTLLDATGNIIFNAKGNKLKIKNDVESLKPLLEAMKDITNKLSEVTGDLNTIVNNMVIDPLYYTAIMPVGPTPIPVIGNPLDPIYVLDAVNAPLIQPKIVIIDTNISLLNTSIDNLLQD